MYCALLDCCSLMCALCGCKSIIYRHMHSSLWNLSIIDSASPTVGTVRGLSLSMTTERLCVCWVLGVYAQVKKRLGRGWRKTHNVRKERCAVQCTAHSLSLAPSLFFRYLLHGFLRETKGLFRSFTYLLPPVPPSLFLWLHFCHFLFFCTPHPPSPAPGSFAL